MWDIHTLVHHSLLSFCCHTLFFLVPTQAFVNIWICNLCELIQILLNFSLMLFQVTFAHGNDISLNSFSSLNLLLYNLQLEIIYCFKVPLDLMINLLQYLTTIPYVLSKLKDLEVFYKLSLSTRMPHINYTSKCKNIRLNHLKLLFLLV